MNSGKLRIGDHWNAITIIALSQSNPLKAVAEFVENSIDARAGRITIIRGKEHGKHFLKIKDDGEGIRPDEQGIPDFHYVATHICDSIKRQLKEKGAAGLQGEFGIGLLSFWTVGEELFLSSAGSDGKMYEMRMRKGDPTFTVAKKRVLLAERGAELIIRPLLPGIKQLSGEKIQWYLASELRDRIRNSGAQITVIDRTARTEHTVEPRKFDGRLLHELHTQAAAVRGLYLELYLAQHDPANAVGLYRSGTRVLDDLAGLFPHAPWTSGYLQGIVDAGYLHLTPGTRTGLIHDETLAQLTRDLAPVEIALLRMVEEQQRAEEERASRDVLRSIQKALKEALLALPAEEYDWFDIRQNAALAASKPAPSPSPSEGPWSLQESLPQSTGAKEDAAGQKHFFDYAGPLYKVKISPASCVVVVDGLKNLRAMARDRADHTIETGVAFAWNILEGEGRFENADREIATFQAPPEPGLIKVQVTARQGSISCQAEGLITVTDSLLADPRSKESTKQGIPSYTFQKAAGELWRSRFQEDQNVIVINNGHRDFVFASRHKALKLRYVCRLFAKELVLRNFAGLPADQLLERLIELSLYTEENLK